LKKVIPGRVAGEAAQNLDFQHIIGDKMPAVQDYEYASAGHPSNPRAIENA